MRSARGALAARGKQPSLATLAVAEEDGSVVGTGVASRKRKVAAAEVASPSLPLWQFSVKLLPSTTVCGWCDVAFESVDLYLYIVKYN